MKLIIPVSACVLAAAATLAFQVGDAPAGPPCARSVQDVVVQSSCLMASEVPQLGRLYPLTQALNVDLSGNVGMGTTTPDSTLTVQGVIHSTLGGVQFPDGTLQATACDCNESLPAGIITMWSGSVLDVPAGWLLCDGTNGTPDLTGRFVMSIPDAFTDPGVTGGSSMHAHGAGTYSASAHMHSFSGVTDSGGNAEECQSGSPQHPSKSDHVHTFAGTTGSGGGGSVSGTSAMATSLPPYYELAFIMKE